MKKNVNSKIKCSLLLKTFEENFCGHLLPTRRKFSLLVARPWATKAQEIRINKNAQSAVEACPQKRFPKHYVLRQYQTGHHHSYTKDGKRIKRCATCRFQGEVGKCIFFNVLIKFKEFVYIYNFTYFELIQMDLKSHGKCRNKIQRICINITLHALNWYEWI